MTSLQLETLFKNAKPREVAGGATVARYGFQANYSILKIVELCAASDDFRIVFDLFDDVVILDSATEPQKAWFYQVKSKGSGSWTTALLCRRDGKTKPRSFVSRLYQHVDQFGASVAETVFASNAPFALTLPSGKKTTASHHKILATDLADAEREKYIASAREDFDAPDTNGWIPRLAFLKIPLGIDEQHIFVIGKIQQHLERTRGAQSFAVTALYETLFAAAMTRAGLVDQSKSALDLLPMKSLTRAEVEELISRVAQRPRSFIENWETIRQDLTGSGIGSVAQIKLQNAAIKYYAERQEGRPRAAEFSDFIDKWTLANGPLLDTCQSITDVMALLRAAMGPELFGFDAKNIQGALLVEAYDAIHE